MSLDNTKATLAVARFRAAHVGASLVLIAWAACCGHAEVKDGRFSDDDVSYKLGEPGEGWQALNIEQANAAWHAPELDASLLVNSHCEGVGDAPLEALTNDLMMGTTEREILQQARFPWSKREAMETDAMVKLDGVPRHLLLFVLKKDGCIYDIVLDARPQNFDAARGAYMRVRSGFDVETRRDRG